MKEGYKFLQGKVLQDLKFTYGEIFRGPKEDIFDGKFVRIGKLIIFSYESNVSHQSLLYERNAGFNNPMKFLRTARYLADVESEQVDAGTIQISMTTKKISVSEKSLRLSDKYIVPVKERARNITGEVLKALSPEDFTITTNQPE